MKRHASERRDTADVGIELCSLSHFGDVRIHGNVMSDIPALIEWVTVDRCELQTCEERACESSEANQDVYNSPPAHDRANADDGAEPGNNLDRQAVSLREIDDVIHRGDVYRPVNKMSDGGFAAAGKLWRASLSFHPSSFPSSHG
jgi:hypothetical protein